MTPKFAALMEEFRANGSSLSAPYVHGLLTATATALEPKIASLWTCIDADNQLSETLKATANEFMSDAENELGANEYQAELGPSNQSFREWVQGYFRSVELHEEQWESLNEADPNIAMAIVTLSSFMDEGVRDTLNFSSSAADEIAESPSILSELATTIYQRLYPNDEHDFAPYSSKAELLAKMANDFDDPYNNVPEIIDPYIRDTPKTGRNDPCPCGSGKKYKKCCMQ